MATAAARAGRVNEDFAAAVPMGAVVVDGAGIAGAEAVCRHGVAWYARRLGGALSSLVEGDEPAAALAAAIEQVTDGHRHTCEVGNPISPSAAVAMIRLVGRRVEYLVLGDRESTQERSGRRRRVLAASP